jgi:hypothetical protein
MKTKGKVSIAESRRPKSVAEPRTFHYKRKVRVKNILGPKTIKKVELRRKVMDLKRHGWSPDEIGDALNVSSSLVRSTIIDCLNLSIKECALDTYQERRMQEERLDALLKINMPAATQIQQKVVIDRVTGKERVIEVQPDPVYTNTVLKIEERRAKLLNLDVAETKKLEVSGVREYVGLNIDDV